MKLIDVPAPLDAALPTCPDNTPFSLEPMKRVGRGERSNVSTLHMSAHGGTHVSPPRQCADALAVEMPVRRRLVVEVAC